MLLALLLQGAGQAATGSAEGGGAALRLQVQVETRTVSVKGATRSALGVEPSTASTQLRCDEGAVALDAGAAVGASGLSLLASVPLGPRSYRVELRNIEAARATAQVSVLCARVPGERRLPVGTGTGAVMVPAAVVAGTGLVAGRTTVTAACTKKSIPVSSGVDLGNGGSLTVREALPSGARKLVVIVENTALEARRALVTVRCVDLPSGFGVTRSTAPVTIPAASGTGATLSPGVRAGTIKCPAGKVPLGGGQSGPAGGSGYTFPALRNGPALGYVFRNLSPETQTGTVAIVCAPKRER